jgi:Tfp pilus assembly protein PilN
MKIAVNLFPVRPQLALPLGALLWLAGSVLVVTAAVLVVDSILMHAERPRLAERLVRIEEQLREASPSGGLPPPAALDAVRERVRALNARTTARGAGTTRIFAWLEKNLPDNVYLVSFHHRPGDGELVLVAETPSAEAFTAFLRRMEQEPWFANIVLNKREVPTAAGSGGLQFELRVNQKS